MLYTLISSLLIFTLIAACTGGQIKRTPATHPSGIGTLLVERNSFYRDLIATEGDAATPTALSTSRDQLDLRGVGDSAWAAGGPPSLWRKRPYPINKGSFSATVQKASPEGVFTAGHLNFINFETVIGSQCLQVGTPDFFFLTHPDQFTQAHASGFNLFSLSNNHANDCWKGPTPQGPIQKGPLMTADFLERASQEAKGQGFLWHGTGRDPWSVSQKTFKFAFSSRGKTIIKPVKVVFAALFLGWETKDSNGASIVAATVDSSWEVATVAVERLLESFDQTDGDLKILSIHTQDGSGDRVMEREGIIMLKQIATEFILNHKGNTVFGTGPHTGAGIKVFTRPDGSRGVLFTSLGNFIHPGLSSKPDNYMGRALFDPETFQLDEIQVIPFRNRVIGRNIGDYVMGTPTVEYCSPQNFDQIRHSDPLRPATWAAKANCSAPPQSNFKLETGKATLQGQPNNFWWAKFR